MRKLAFAIVVLALLSGITGAQPAPRKDDRWREPRFEREVWILLPPAGVEASALKRALRNPVPHERVIALEARDIAPRETPLTESERETLRIVGLKADLARQLGLKADVERSRDLRLVLVGFYETCADACTLAMQRELGIEQLVLIEPALDELPAVSSHDAQPGVDVFASVASPRALETLHAQARAALGAWGKSARVFDLKSRDKDLATRTGEAASRLRSFTIHDLRGPRPAPVADSGALSGLLAGYDVVFFGELHGHPAGHVLQRELFMVWGSYQLGNKRRFALSTEHFERDAQGAVNDYLAGRIDEAAFRKAARAWPNHADYRAMVELCRQGALRTEGIPLIAGNIPRRLANRVFKEGPEVIAKFSEEEKGWTAPELNAPAGAYRDKFMKLMGMSDELDDAGKARLERMFAAQCIKDDTMAESIANWLDQNEGGRVYHINGAFHSEAGLGVPERLLRLKPGLKVAIVTVVESQDPAHEKPRTEELKGNDFVVYVPASRQERDRDSGPHK